jgi:hypothetical protein
MPPRARAYQDHVLGPMKIPVGASSPISQRFSTRFPGAHIFKQYYYLLLRYRVVLLRTS